MVVVSQTAWCCRSNTWLSVKTNESLSVKHIVGVSQTQCWLCQVIILLSVKQHVVVSKIPCWCGSQHYNFVSQT